MRVVLDGRTVSLQRARCVPGVCNRVCKEDGNGREVALPMQVQALAPGTTPPKCRVSIWQWQCEARFTVPVPVVHSCLTFWRHVLPHERDLDQVP